MPSIISKWERLGQLDLGSGFYNIRLTHLLNNDADVKATTSLEEEEAVVVLDILANVRLIHRETLDSVGADIFHQSLNRDKNPVNLSAHILRVLRKLAYNSGQVPNSYKIDRDLSQFEILPGAPFARGGFSDVQKGTLDGKLVAVKTLRLSQQANVAELQKVTHIEHFLSMY